MARLPQPARPPGSLGTSGQHFVPDPSPSLDPTIFGQIEPKDTVRQLGVKALTIAKRQAAAARNGARQAHSDPQLSSVERYRRAHDISTAALMPAAEAIEKALAAYSKEITATRAATAGPSGLDLSDVRLAEIRSKLSGLPQDDRYAKIARAIERGNDEVAAAVLNADRFFTDFLLDVELSTLRALWAKLRMPESVARLAQLESDQRHIERTGKILVSYQLACAGPSIVQPPAPAGSTAPPLSPYGREGTGGIEGAAMRARRLSCLTGRSLDDG
jgi:hypothetical protein